MTAAASFMEKNISIWTMDDDRELHIRINNNILYSYILVAANDTGNASISAFAFATSFSYHCRCFC